MRAASTRFVVYTRDDCALCAEFVSELRAILPSFEMRDVDADATTRRRFGHKVPVLTCDGRFVCHGHVDQEVVLRLLRGQKPAVDRLL